MQDSSWARCRQIERHWKKKKKCLGWQRLERSTQTISGGTRKTKTNFQIGKKEIYRGNIQSTNRKNVTFTWAGLLRRNDNSWMNVILKLKCVDGQTNGHTSPIWIHPMHREGLTIKLHESCIYLQDYLDCNKINGNSSTRHTEMQFQGNLLSVILWTSEFWQGVVGSDTNVLGGHTVSTFCRWQYAPLRWHSIM
jgi:hypothetical protein